jgi:hypothetical protein
MSQLPTWPPNKEQTHSYLLQLARLVRRSVRPEDLLSLEETEAVRTRANTVRRRHLWRVELPFSEKSTPRFRGFVHDLMQLNPSPVYVWTELSNACGVLPPVPLDMVNFDFDFDTDPTGVLVLLSADLQDKMLLDYSESESGRRTVEVEVSGDHWGIARLADAASTISPTPDRSTPDD